MNKNRKALHRDSATLYALIQYVHIIIDQFIKILTAVSGVVLIIVGVAMLRKKRDEK